MQSGFYRKYLMIMFEEADTNNYPENYSGLNSRNRAHECSTLLNNQRQHNLAVSDPWCYVMDLKQLENIGYDYYIRAAVTDFSTII